MFGGSSRFADLPAVGDDLVETWSWTDSGWQQLRPASSPPTSRIWDDLLFDPTKNRLTLFGGRIVSNTWVPETWVWGNSNWTEVQSLGAPTFHDFPDDVYEQHRINIRYLDSGAGVIKSVPFRQCCTDLSPNAQSWDGSQWVGDRPASWMPPAAGGGDSFFPPGRYLFTFGGDTCRTGYEKQPVLSDDEAWAWDGTAWTQLHSKTNPPARSTTYLAFDSRQNRVVMFGGYVQGSCGVLAI
jgi:hypothetical protein